MSRMIAEQGQLICAPASLVWNKLTQVEQWTQWLPRLKAAELLETPKLDAIGKAVPVGGSPYHFRFSRFYPESQLQIVRPYRFGTHLIQNYCLTRNAEGVVLTIEMFCTGALELQVGLLTRRKMSRELLDLSVRLKAVCEKEASDRQYAERLAPAS